MDFLRGFDSSVFYFKDHFNEIAISYIVIAELYAGVKDNERDKLDDFISLFPVFPVNSEIAKLGGLIKRDYCKSHKPGLADALIAATTVVHNLELKTMNIKHYPMLKGLKPPYVK